MFAENGARSGQLLNVEFIIHKLHDTKIIKILIFVDTT